MFEFLAEQEFDRRFVVKKVIARTLLRRAAETDDLKKAKSLAIRAAEIFAQLPDKESSRWLACVCGSRKAWSENKPLYYMNQLVDVQVGPVQCGKCLRPWNPVESFRVRKGVL